MKTVTINLTAVVICKLENWFGILLQPRPTKCGCLCGRGGTLVSSVTNKSKSQILRLAGIAVVFNCSQILHRLCRW
jgi:hypothetical protein